MQNQQSSQKAFLCINQRKISPQEFIELLEKNKIHPHTTENTAVVDDVAVFEIPGFSEGLFFVQDISAMKVTQFLKVEKSNAVLDMCSAPGGKTTHIAELLGDTGRICTLDISLKRLQLIQENCRRMAVQNVFIVCGDASGEKVPFHVKFDGCSQMHPVPIPVYCRVVWRPDGG